VLDTEAQVQYSDGKILRFLVARRAFLDPGNELIQVTEDLLCSFGVISYKCQFEVSMVDA
jgi:hypothetical protein